MSTSKRNIDRRLRALEALRLRNETDLSWAEIASQTGYATPQSAQRGVARALNRVETKTVNEHRDALDAQLAWLWDETAEKLIAADKGSMSYATLVGSAVRIIDRRAKLFGLDGPTRVEASVSVKSELDVEIEHLVDHLKRQPEESR
ncbi:hypothetical protein ACFTWF_03165 [Rhodococcus sp. NPDC056960]|uniref:hypothetical protein n=1 Tax=Rhodococcus sp. NPDC056960 TaxID=3345982 RepID=UPI003627E3EF